MDAFFSLEVLWFLLGAVFFLLELLIPGVVFVFFGIAAWLTGGMTYLFGVSLEVQLLVFLLSSVLGILTLRRLFKERFMSEASPTDEDLVKEFEGEIVIAETDFDSSGSGKVAFRGSTWKASSFKQVQKGDRLRVLAKENIRLSVEPIQKQSE